MDYAANSGKAKRAAEQSGDEAPAEKKEIVKVVTGEVIVQKPGLGRKIKDIFVEADLRGAARYVGMEVLVPALRNLIVDASTKGIERWVYGETAIRRRPQIGPGPGGPRFTYNAPVNRQQSIVGRNAPPIPIGPRVQRQTHDNLILSSKDDAETVVERLNDIIDRYGAASVADLNELVGIAGPHTDNKWGWTHLGDLRVMQVREGYLIEFPQVEVLQ